jgi:serine/threonine protein kinase/tetratricopeptide (TPR) repeat protein
MIGKTISHYKIIEKLGAGGMGVVFKAEDTKLKRTVALKFLPQELTRESSAKKRFIQEAQTISSLDHQNIGAIYEISETEDGQLYIVMAYYKGETLRERIKKGLLKESEVIDITIQVLRGLSKAHERDIIHRDIKPANIIITDEGVVKIIDFGVAKLTWQVDLTKTRSTLGTTAYMSPQQICAESVDRRTDIWSVGITLYEAITGHLPFSGEYEQAIIYSILTEDPAPPSSLKKDILKELDQLINRAIQKEPKNRYQNSLEFIEELKSFTSTVIDKKKINEYWIKRKSPISMRSRLMKFMMIITTVIIVLFIILFSFIEINKSKVVKDIIVYEKLDNDTSHNQPIYDMFRYLFVDDLLQSSEINIFSKSEFDFLYPGKTPEITIEYQIIIQDIGFEIDIVFHNPLKKTIFNFYQNDYRITSHIFDPSILLSSEISEITSQLLQILKIPHKNKSTFTKSWDAFEYFYEGEKAHNKLDITKAHEYFRSALNIDPNFVLAKVRLADVLEFYGSYSEAQELIKSIKPKLGLLSDIDSIKAESLLARLNGDVRKEISLLRNIYNRYPSRKESAFCIAEAYYELCDITNAIKFYKKTLHLDETFPLAHNHLAYCYSHLGEHKKALHHFKTYVSLDGTANTYDSMGDGYMATGNLDSAVWAKEQGIMIDPKLAYLYRGLVYIHLRRGSTQKAMTNADKYLYYAYSNERKAIGLYLKALVEYEKHQYTKSLTLCLKAKELFDSYDLVSRNHELHWLLCLIYFKLNRMEEARKEINEMQSLIITNNINETNYRAYIYKYTLDLLAYQAANNGDIISLLNIIKQFDGPLKNKVKDHGSPFDLAFFNNDFGELFLYPKINREDYAEERFRKALDYNPNFAMAHYNLWQLYKNSNKINKAKEEREIFANLWRDADINLKKLFKIGDN